MTNQTSRAELQMKADLAALRDILKVQTQDVEPDTHGERVVSTDCLRLETAPTSYSVMVFDRMTDEDDISDTLGSTVMSLGFSNDLDDIRASICFNNTRNFDRKISQRALGGFVAGILTNVENELALEV